MYLYSSILGSPWHLRWLYPYYIVPSTDAVEYPEYYQITGDLLNALQRFSDNTRSRLDSCALPSGVIIVEY